MKSSSKETEKENLDNFDIVKEKFFSTILGFGDLKSPFYKVYILLIYAVYGYFEWACWMTLQTTDPMDRELLVKVVHIMILLGWSAATLSCKLLFHRSVREMRARLREGIFNYEGEEADPAAIVIKREGRASLNKASNFLYRLMSASVFYNMVIYPLALLLTLKEDHPENGLNPYLNSPVYMPFNTRTALGYCAGIFLCTLYFLLNYGIATLMNDHFILHTVSAATHFRLLNHSLESLPRRAAALYRASGGKEPVRRDDPVYQACLYRCLIANIQHRRAIHRFLKIGHLYVGWTLFVTISVAAGVLATTCSLLLERISMNKFFNILFLAVGESAYPFTLSWLGQKVINESEQTHYSLYWTPWIDGDLRFKKTVLLMMAGTKKPTSVNTAILNLTASLRVFGDIVSGVYKLINVIRE